MKKKVIIMGAKGTALNIAEAICDAADRFSVQVEFLGFAFDDESFGNACGGFEILCKTREAESRYGRYEDVFFLFQMNNKFRMRERAELISSYGIGAAKWMTFVHPSAFISRSVKLGVGCVVMPHCAVHSNAVIGNHCTLSSSTTVGHDSVLGNNVFTATHVCIGSSVKIGSYNFFGQGALVPANISIEAENLIGIGSLVNKDVRESGMVLFGSPARVHKTLQHYR